MPTFEISGRRLEIVDHSVDSYSTDSGRVHSTDSRRSPTLLFLHEGLGSVAGWRGLPRRVGQETGLPWVAYSRLGYGESEALPSDGLRTSFLDDEATTTLPALVDHLALQKTILVGHSDGASIALRYALDHPPGLLGLVLIAPHTFVEEVTLEGIRAAAKRFKGSGTSGSNRLRTALERQHGDKTEQTFRAWTSVWLSEAFRGWDLRPRLHRLAYPTLLIQGTLDQYGTFRQIDSITGSAPGPIEVLWQPGCGHAPHLERFDETTDRIVQFVAKLVDHAASS